jgi:PE family
MSTFVIATPDALATASTDLTGIESAIWAARAAAAGSTPQLAAAARDEVSTAIASLLSSHAQAYQALSAQASAFHAEFVQTLSGAGSVYAAAEAGNPPPLQAAAQDLAAFSPVKDLTGRPLFGNGAVRARCSVRRV